MQRENQSKLNRLIQELCPEGVEYRKLGEVLTICNGKDYKNLNPGSVPVYGSGGVLTYVDKSLYDKPSVLIPRKGSLDKLYYLEIPFWTVDTLFYTDINCSLVVPKFVYYVLQKEHLEDLNVAGGVPSLTQKVLNLVPIPVPPLPVQSEIVRILDAFTALTAELTAELTARRKQYEYYRDRLLKFDDLTGGIRWVELNEVAKGISSGKNKEKLEGGSFPVYGSTGIIAYTETAVYDEPRILVARVGANAGYVHIADGMYDVSDNTLIIDLKMDKALLRYVYHVLTNMNINQYAKGGGQPLITASLLKDLPIPLPPLSEQRRIVSILDRFDALCNDLTVGLPAEIDARRKQYEFYRDRLLDFQRKE